MIIALLFTWIILLLLGWLGWLMLRQNGRLLLRIEDLEQRLDAAEFGGPPAPEGLPVGTVAPEFDLPDLAGERRKLAQFRAQPLLLVFFNPACGFCRDMAPKLAAVQQAGGWRPEAGGQDGGQGSGFRVQPSMVRGQASGDSVPQPSTLNSQPAARPLVVVITTGDAEKNRQFFREQKITGPVLLQKDGEVAKAYQANGTPTGYLINAEGKIASELAIGADALLKLAEGKAESGKEKAEMTDDGRANRFADRSLVRSKIARNGLKAGTPAPLFRLPRLDGGELALEEWRGSRVLLLFSDPNCVPCEALLPQIEQWHCDHPQIRVVMISRGEPKENRAKVKTHGLTFPVVLQLHWEISRKYAMFATPIAYLVDEDGLVAHDVAVGPDAILKLLTDVAANHHNS
jgi:peroxiredoxin